MRKIILLITATLFATGAFAQKNLNWGVKGGLNVSTITKTTYDQKVSFHVGLFLDFKVIANLLSIQLEILYSREGAMKDARNWQRINYINIPVLAKIYVLDRLSIDVGPQISILINAKRRMQDSSFEDIKESNRDDLDSLNVAIGLGLSYKLTRKFDVSVRYNLGLINILQYEGSRAKNNVLMLSVGYKF